MYVHQSERMILGTLGISVDESISDSQHSPYKTLKKYVAIQNYPQNVEQLTMHALSDDRSSWTAAAC